MRVYAGQDPVTKRRHDLVTSSRPARRCGTGPRRFDRGSLLTSARGAIRRRQPRSTSCSTATSISTPEAGARSRATGSTSTSTSARSSVRRRSARSTSRSWTRCTPRCGDAASTAATAAAWTTGPASLTSATRDANRTGAGPSATPRSDKIHYVLSGAYKRAVRWRWVALSPMAQAEPPPVPAPDPQPPTPEEAARLVAEAWRRDPDRGMFVWLTMVTGARRGEVCGLRWQHVDLERGVITDDPERRRHRVGGEHDARPRGSRRGGRGRSATPTIRARG